MPVGYWCPVLHAHLPYVRHPEYPEFLEEDWFFEAITETYIPLIRVMQRLTDDGVRIDRELCETCGRCVDICPTGALEMVGRESTVDEVLSEVLRDVPFYETSGGGMTLSGGEPTLDDRLPALIEALREADARIKLDTNGTRPDVLEALIAAGAIDEFDKVARLRRHA